jgi:hypothetical protein
MPVTNILARPNGSLSLRFILKANHSCVAGSWIAFMAISGRGPRTTDPPVMERDGWVNEVAAKRPQARERPLLV